MRASQRAVRAVSRLLLSRDAHERVSRLAQPDAGHGYDVFGMHRDWLELGLGLLAPFYRGYFRVSSHDAHNLPARGPAILIANHAGTLPIDAAMIVLDVFEHTEPPRLLRPIADVFLPQLPFASAMLARMGVVPGARGNVLRLLEQGELCLIFPEGTPAIGKPRSERYRLQDWRVGHAELALRKRVPVVPVAVIGSEEQWPQLARLRAIRPFGAPYLPLPATPLPLPVHYHIHYGTPLELSGELEGALNAQAIEAAAKRTRQALQALIEHGLRQRRGVFR